MKKKNNVDVLDMISSFQKDVMKKKPSFRQMYDEVRMMRFKIRPLQGEITLLDLQNNNFIEMLWGLGKLDEFYQIHVQRLNNDQKRIFFRIFEEIYQKFQQELNKLNLNNPQPSDKSLSFEMEIFKDRSPHYN